MAFTEQTYSRLTLGTKTCLRRSERLALDRKIREVHEDCILVAVSSWESFAGTVLRRNGVQVSKLDEYLKALPDVRRGTPNWAADRGRRSGLFGRRGEVQVLLFSSVARETMEAATRASSQMDHGFISPEHLALGCLDVGGRVETLLVHAGLEAAEIRGQIVDGRDEWVESAQLSWECERSFLAALSG